MLCFSLRCGVIAFRVFGPIKRQPLANQPISKINAGYRANGHRSLVAIAINFDARHRPTIDKGGEIIRRLLTAAIMVAVRVAAKLITFWRVDTRQPDALAMDFDRIAIDYRSLSLDRVRTLCGRRCRGRQQPHSGSGARCGRRRRARTSGRASAFNNHFWRAVR